MWILNPDMIWTSAVCLISLLFIFAERYLLFIQCVHFLFTEPLDPCFVSRTFQRLKMIGQLKVKVRKYCIMCPQSWTSHDKNIISPQRSLKLGKEFFPPKIAQISEYLVHTHDNYKQNSTPTLIMFKLHLISYFHIHLLCCWHSWSGHQRFGQKIQHG